MSIDLFFSAALAIQPAVKPNSYQPTHIAAPTTNTLILSVTEYQMLAIREEDIRSMLKPQLVPLLGEFDEPNRPYNGICNQGYSCPRLGSSDTIEREPRIRK